MTTRRPGFTFLEILIVVAVIGLLGSIAIYSLSGFRKTSTLDERAKRAAEPSPFPQFDPLFR